MNSITNFHIPTTVVMQSCISASFVIFAPLCAFVWPCAVVLLLIREVEGESTHNLSDCNSRNVFSLDRSENPAQFSNHYYLLTGKVVGAPCGLSIGRLSCRQQQALQKKAVLHSTTSAVIIIMMVTVYSTLPGYYLRVKTPRQMMLDHQLFHH